MPQIPADITALADTLKLKTSMSAKEDGTFDVRLSGGVLDPIITITLEDHR